MEDFRRAVVPALALALLLAGCGSPTPTPTPRSNTSPTSATPPTGSAGIDIHSATAATPDPTDVKVQLNPKLYTDPNDPCAGVTVTTDAGNVPSNCAVMFVGMGSPVIPGPDKVDGSQEPKTARVSTTVDPSQGVVIGNAFFLAQVMRFWAMELNVATVIPSLDGLFAANDSVYKTMSSKPILDVQVPPCAYPTGIRITTVNSDVQDYMVQQGWPTPSNVAVIATYDQCTGVLVNYKDGSSTTVLGHDKPVSVVATGGVTNILPFGMLWLQNGWAPCGPAALKSLCPSS